MKRLNNASLAPFTSFEAGGNAEQLLVCEKYKDALTALAETVNPTVLGFGCNVLVSDAGLPGTTLVLRSGQVTIEAEMLIADAGAWWDDAVLAAIKAGLFGIELMSAIPGGVGAAVVGNIAAYGQAVADSLAWVEVYDPAVTGTRRLLPNELGLKYRFSDFQTEKLCRLVILRAGFKLSRRPTTELSYQSALDAATEHGWDITTLEDRRHIILEARRRAGSLWDYRDHSHRNKTAGSFFRNPQVSAEQAERIIAHDETGKSAELIKKMNSVHGGDSLRVSAAHVLLAAGFKRGQTWGDVRLHPQHVLKIENVGRASAQNIYDVAHEIMATVEAKLGIQLVPEVRFVGDFS